MATCLFGGTFNPFHNGHFIVMRHVKKVLNLDRMILFPSAKPPHKPLEILASGNDRLNMVSVSLDGIEGFECSDIEFKRAGPSFTIDTMEEFSQIYFDELFLLMGADSFLGMASWKNFKKIFQTVSVIVMPRDEQQDLSIFSAFIDETLETGYRWKTDRFVHERMKEIIVCPVPKIDISSTMIRDRVSRGKDIDALVPPGVSEIIRKKDLYK